MQKRQKRFLREKINRGFTGVFAKTFTEISKGKEIYRMNSLIYKELGVVEEGQSPDPTMPIWVRVEATGICGTDLKAVFKGHRYFVPPTVLGQDRKSVV